MLELKKDEGTGYVFNWKSKGVYNSKLKPLYTAFLHSIKLSGYKMGINFYKDLLAVEQNKYLIKIVNIYIVYDLDAWPKIMFRNFTLKNCLFGVTNIVKNSDQEKYVYSGYGIVFDGKCESSFGNKYARNVIVFGVDNSISSHTNNLMNNFLILDEVHTFGIKGSFGAPEKMFSFSFSKASTKCCLSSRHNTDNSYLFVNEKETVKFKVDSKNVNFPTQFNFVWEVFGMDLVLLSLEKYL